MKKIVIVFFALLAMSADAQIDTVLYKTFTDMEAPSSWTKIVENPSGYEGWAFKECFTQATDGGSKIRVGDEDTRGSVTLPTLGGLNGNARITMEVRFDDTGKFYVKNDNSGTVYGTNQSIEASNWTWITPILLRGGDETSRIVIYRDSKAATKHFLLRNVQVCDMGDNIYWETFDKANGIGGNDGTMNVDFAGTAYSSGFDYVESLSSNLTKGDRCAYLSGEPSRFTTDLLPIKYIDGSKCFVSFRAAKRNVSGSLSVKEKKVIDDSWSENKLSSIDLKKDTWTDYTLEIPYLEKKLKLVFEGFGCFLDEIRVWEVGYLSEDGDNAGALAHNTEENIMLNRTLGAGYWNTLCLPFDFSLDGELPEEMEGKKVELMELTGVQDGAFVFNSCRSVSAGKPFLIHVDEAVVNPVFRHVTVTQSEPLSVTFDDYQMVGTYNPKDLTYDGTNLFLGTDGVLYQPTEGDHEMRGLRAYFVVPSGANARVMLYDDEQASVKRPSLESTSRGATYDLSGRTVKAKRGGLYIEKGKKSLW